MYRPKGWRNGYSKEREEDGMLSRYEIFEAGADAYEAALKEEGQYWGSIVENPVFSTTKKGWLVFIEERGNG